MTEAMRKRSKIKAGRRERLTLAITAVALRGGVIASLIYLLLTLAWLIAAPPAFTQTAPVGAGVRLEAGIEKEDVDGDLKSAMDIYQKIAADTSASREVRAKALLRLAGCDEKLGKQAKQVYEQIVRDYADQPSAAQARKRLALIQKQEHPALPTTMSARKIETAGLGQIDAWDTDGEKAVYRAADGNLYFGDVSGHKKQLVFKAEPGDSLDWQPSIDFSLVALQLPPKPNRPAALAVVNIDGTGYRELVRDDQQSAILADAIYLYWSWDKRFLLLSISSGKGGGKPGKDGSHLLVISVADGRRRELVQTKVGYISKAVFSPDGRFVAYEVMPPWGESKSGTCRVFVVAAAGGEPHLVYESKEWNDYGRMINALKDWTADGRYLVLKDTELGKSALYLLLMKNGAPTGDAEMVRYGDLLDAYTTASGALLYKEPSTKTIEKDAFIASLSSEGQVGNWRRLELRGGRSPRVDPFPSLSPNGTAVAYLASDQDAGETDIVLRELSTGQERVVYRSSAGRFYCHYASGLPKIFCTSSKKDESSDLISVAVESGAVERLSSFDGPRFIHQLSPDDSIVYFTSDNFPILGSILQWNMAAQKEITLSTQLDKLETYAPSPDGNWLVRTTLSSNMSVRPMSGGAWRNLVFDATGLWWQTVVSPDSKWVFFHTIDQVGKHSLFRVAVTGGQPERLGDFPCESFSGLLNMSSEGRQILATCNGGSEGNAGYDLWVLENFVPSPKK